MNREDLSRYAITAIVGGSGVLHLTSPEFYKRIMPRPLAPYDAEIVFVSGLAEMACAAAMTVPATRRLGGWLTALLLVSVFPANVQMALDGGMHNLKPPWNSPAVAWIRLPFQLPMILMAIAVARQARPGAGSGAAAEPQAA